MFRRLRVLVGGLLVVAMASGVSVCWAGGFAKSVSDATAPAIAAGVITAYLNEGKPHAARVADAAVAAFGFAEILKPNLNVNDNGFNHSFPSGHTAVAFATASSLAQINPKQKWLYYGGAALIGWSRVETRAHTWKDVLGGAALGITVGKWSVSSTSGLMLGRAYKF